MVNVYLSGADARNAAADLWQQDQLKQLNDQFAPPPAPPEPAQPLPPAPVEAAGVQGSSLPSPPAAGLGVTQPAPPAAVPPPSVAPNPTPDRNQIADQFTRSAIADAWEQNAISDVTKGVSQAGQGVQSALADVPKEAQGLVSNYSALPGATAPPPAQPAPSAISGIPAPQPTQGQVATVAGGGGTDVEQYIRQSAATHGIDPDTAVRVAQSEGGLTNPVRQSDYVDPSTGQREQSFGPFQLYLGGGLGNAALKAGIDPRDPNQWRQAVDFALDQAAKGGWSPWHGAARAGIGNFEGIGQAVGGGQQAASTDTQPISRPAGDWLAIAKEQLGKPYIWGSAGGRSTFDPNAPGFDCSGFVSYVMKKAFGVDLPAFTGTAYTATRPLQEGETPGAAGQVAFYNMGQSDPHLQHIALSIGNGQVIQAGGRRNDVNTDVANDIGTPEWRVPVGIPGKLADAAQQVVGAGAAAAQAGQNVQQAVQQTAQGIIGAVGNVGGTLGTTAGNIGQSVGSAWQQAGQANAANPMIQNMIASSSPSTINPYRDIVQEGIPSIVQGVQQGDVGKVLSGGLQVVGGVSSALPGPEGGIASSAAPAVAEAAGGRQAGQAAIPFATTLGGAAAGGTAGYLSDPNASPQERIARTLGGAAVGAGLGYGAARIPDLFERPPTEPAALPTTVQPAVAPGEVAPSPARLNVNLTKYPEEVQQVIQAAAPSIPQEATRGVMPDALVRDLSQQSGVDVPTIVSNWKPGQAQNAETLLALRDSLAAQGQKVLGAQQALRANPDSVDAQVALVQALTTHRAIQEVVQGTTAEAGRALRQFTQPVEGSLAALQQLQRFASDTGQTVDDVARKLASVDLSDPAQVAQAARALTPPATFWDVLRAGRVGSLAGGVQTVTHIALNAPLQTGWKLLTDTPAAIISGHPETIPMEFVGAWQGLRNWAMNASQTLTQPGQLATKMGGGAGAQALETGLLGLVKTHPVLQDMARELGSNMELWRAAAQQATDAGYTRLSGPWQAEVQRLVANPPPALQQAAERAGDTFALRGPMGLQGQKMTDWLRGNKLGQFLLPFFNIGYHVASQGVERSPLGLAGTAFDIARAPLGSGPYAAGAANKAVTPLAERLRNNLVGTGLAAEAYSQAAQGNITGNGPDDPAQRAELMSQGWLPNSTLIGGRWVDNHVLGPLGWSLSEAANLAEARGDTPYTRGTKDVTQRDGMQQFGNYVGRMGQYLEDETFLRSFGQILQAVGSSKDAGRLGEQEVASVAGSLVPQGALISNVASAMDPLARRPQPGDLGQALETRFPGLREQVPVRTNAVGEPEQNPQYGAGVALPRSGTGQPSPVLTLLAGAGITLPTNPPKDINYSGRQITLSPDEQQLRQQMLGQRLTQTTQGYVNSSKFQALQPDQQKRALEPLVRAAEQYADQRVVAAMTPQDRRARLATAPRTGASAPVYPAAGSGLAGVIARQSAADADAAHQRLLAQYAGQQQPQLAGAGP